MTINSTDLTSDISTYDQYKHIPTSDSVNKATEYVNMLFHKAAVFIMKMLHGPLACTEKHEFPEELHRINTLLNNSLLSFWKKRTVRPAFNTNSKTYLTDLLKQERMPDKRHNFDK